MVLTDKVVSTQEVMEALQEVMDPEIPVLSVVDLGIIAGVHLEEDFARIKMIPTFTACPAIQVMRKQIKEKVVSLGFEQVEVEVDKSISWNSNLMSEEGKRKLKQFGLGTPLRHNGDFDLKDIEDTACPHCGSQNTTMNSLFGSTLCRSVH